MWATLHAFEHNNLDRMTLIPAPKYGRTLLEHGRRENIDQGGTNEPERMRAGLQKLHTSLLEANIQHVFYDSPGTDHEWQTWCREGFCTETLLTKPPARAQSRCQAKQCLC